MEIKKGITENYELFGVSFLTLLFIVIGALLAYYNGLSGMALISTIVTFTILISSYSLLSTQKVKFFLQEFFDSNPYLIWAAILLFSFTYTIYSSGNNSFTLLGLGKLVLFLFLPTVIIFLSKEKKAASWQDFLVVLLIWLPFDFRLLNGIWVGKVVYAFNVLVAFSLAIVLFVHYRKIEDVGYSFYLNKQILYQGLINFVLFAPIGIGLGLITGFLIWAPSSRGFLPVFLTALGIFLFTALPEELLFRGLMQNLLAKTSGNNNFALAFSSVVFGLAHLNNAPFPKNITYCFLAMIAGFFYGRAYFATKSILAGAITHALVDTVWHELFK
jgi:hypothetical protein